MNLQSNDFELFDLPQQFAQDRATVDARWKALQRQAHPDRFADQGAAAQRVAMQWSVRINEAYQRLKNPVSRAAYLCELRGAPVNAERNTQMPASFLMQQMVWRETLDEADTDESLDALATEVRQAHRMQLEELARLLDQVQDPVAAVAVVRALMFIERFQRDIETRQDQRGQ